MEWSRITLILCIYGILRDFRPSEIFITNYLITWKNITSMEINQKLFPVSTYSYFASLIVVFLLIDMVRYKPIIILSSLSGAICFSTIQFSTNINFMYFAEFVYGILLSTEVSYYTYIYAKVDKKHYQKVTSYTRGAYLCGRFMSSIIAQLSMSFSVLTLEHLNYITIISLCLATFWACFLPAVNHSMYFNRLDLNTTPDIINNSIENTGNKKVPSVSELKISTLEEKNSFIKKVRNALHLLWLDFTKAYSNKYVCKWSLWWAAATCGYLQFVNYIQLLWEDATDTHKQNIKNVNIYNGVAEGLSTVISFITVFCIGRLNLNWPLVGEVMLAIFSILEGMVLVLSYITYNLWILYTIYIVFGVIYQGMVTIANFEVAKHISEDSYGLIFGINTFVALLLQTILTSILVDERLNLGIKTQFLILGGYFIVLGIIFIIMSAFTVNKYCKQQQPIKIWLNKNKDSDINLQEKASELTS